MTIDRLTARAAAFGEARAEQWREQLMATDLPQGVHTERTSDGVGLVGKNLRRRMIDDPRLRNFGR